MRVINPDHRLIAHKLTYLRDKRTDSPTFRRLAEELMTLLAYEATRDVRVEPFEIETPVAPTTGIKLSNPKPLIVPILRAGLGMLEGMVRLLPSAEVGFLGMQRDEETLQAITYANRLPDDLSGRQVYVLDPMLATGGSMADAIKFLIERGADDITAVTLLSAPEGIAHLQQALADVAAPITLVTGAIDEKLNEVGYIVPGPRRRRRPALRPGPVTAAERDRSPRAATTRHPRPSRHARRPHHPSHASHLTACWLRRAPGRPDAGGRDMPPIKKIVLWLVVIFLLYAIFTAPTEAANMFQAAWDFTVNAVQQHRGVLQLPDQGVTWRADRGSTASSSATSSTARRSSSPCGCTGSTWPARS